MVPGPPAAAGNRAVPLSDRQYPMPAGASFAAVLAGCRSLFPPALLGAAGWERLLEQARRLPSCVADHHFGFEFRLGESSPAADLGVVVLPASELARHYVRKGARAEPGSPAAALAAGLREQTENPDSYLARGVAGMVLEYDLAKVEPDRPPPAPGIFFTPRHSAPGARPEFHEHGDPAGLLAALAVTAGWSSYEDEVPRVERILASLPDSGYLLQAGALPGRSPKAFRLVIKGVAKDAIPALLERIEWPGPAAEAAEVLAALDDLVAYAAVSLDVTTRGVGPRLGLELYRPPKWFAVDRTGWHPFIARIEERGWCLPAKADGLRSWPGAERLLADREVRAVRRGINHVKVVIAPDTPTAAKAYAGMDVHPYGSTPALR